ncbi:MAG: hypothetical protein ACQEUY_06320 [Pseudomonadota bacterium]
MRKMTLSVSALVLGLAAGSASADSNSLFIEQVGDNNFGGGSQSSGNDNEGYIQAFGDNNTASFALTKPSAGVANRNDVLVKVTGNRNLAQFGFNDQDGQMLRNDIGLVANGYANVNQYELTGNFNTALTDTTLFVEQTGDNNFSSDSQEVGGSTNAGGGGATVALPNFGSFGLEGPDNATAQSGVINGDGHFIGLRQDGSNNAMQMSVTGTSNTIRGFSTDPGSASQSDFNGYTDSGNFFDNDTSFASLDDTLAHQNGDFNVGVIQVQGADNDVQFAQTGSFNTAEVYQQGNGNISWVGQ